MRKTNISALAEIGYLDVQNLNNFLEQQFALFARDFMQVSSGVVYGLAVASGSVTALTIASGAIFTGLTGLFGELESASGLIISLPASGIRTDLVAARYVEVLDTPGSGYVITNVTTQTEQIQINMTRKFGSCQISLLQSTTALTCPAGYIPLAEVTSNATTITIVNDVRLYAAVQRFVTDIKQMFYGMFYAGF